MRVDPSSFEQAYRQAGDPWGFATSPYELGKYAATVDGLVRGNYRRAFEPGCSIGVLSELLAGRVGALVACDPSPTAAAAARARLHRFDHVTVVEAAIPEWWPHGTFDLIVLSEIGYYWDTAGLRSIVERLAGALDEDGDLVAVHWRGHSDDHLLSGDAVHDVIAATIGLAAFTDVVEPQGSAGGDGYVLQRWRKHPA